MIQVGQVLDKYELLERVGQGGMAVVYRGLDRTLKRTVAVKILHKHLSDYQEARDRFEREAQAVAKLRHENILEIFDYAAKADDCYIVTEFIDGQTLKQFTTERPIQFPEIGAMVLLQVCRALAHAHAGGILHRDVKPENIMIRSDGVVKLMDFGISHMVDLERLTVTGQLLGSPAYMAPEHVEGRPLDFRTDVFAAGIVLYQLTVGKLPFEGKNPHEVLKRIAECRFVDPRQANPRIGNRLGRIILRAMAAEPANRYPAISEMVIALETYLEDSGISRDKVASELARYFQAPASYEQTLAVRLVDHLTRRGQELLDADDRAGALDAFDRVLTIDPANEKVIAILDKLNRRARFQHLAIAVAGVAVVAGSAYAIYAKMQPEAPEPPADVVLHNPDDHDKPVTTTGHEVKPVAADAAPATTMASADAQTVAVTPRVDAGVQAAADAGGAVAALTIEVKTWRGSQYRVDGGGWQLVEGDTFSVDVVDHPVAVDVKNDCCMPQTITLDRNSSKTETVRPQFRAASITPHCDVKNASVTIDGKPVTLGESFNITFDKNATSSTKSVSLVFTDGKTNNPQTVTVSAGKPSEVTCELH